MYRFADRRCISPKNIGVRAYVRARAIAELCTREKKFFLLAEYRLYKTAGASSIAPRRSCKYIYLIADLGE